jgi:hypothetical protein
LPHFATAYSYITLFLNLPLGLITINVVDGYFVSTLRHVPPGSTCSRRASSSRPPSTYSQSSTRHLIQGSETPPNPFASANLSTTSFIPHNDSQPLPKDGTPVSLSVNYLPSKFSNTLLAPGSRKRKGKGGIDPLLPKRGGGVEAFRSGEARMPGENDVDYDGLSGGLFGGKEGGHTRPRLRWNKFKWTLFVANAVVSFNVFFFLLRQF